MLPSSYSAFINKLVEEGKTSGHRQTQALVNFTKLNQQRMSRIAKTVKINEDLVKALHSKKEQIGFMIVTETWCGDAAQSLPVFIKLADLSGIDTRIILRDENPELIDSHLTDGGRSIPIVIGISKSDWKPLFVWGPRPLELQRYALSYKHAAEPKISHDEFVLQLQQWYNKDKQQSIQRELTDLIA